MELGIRLMVENTIEGMMMKIEDSTTSRWRDIKRKTNQECNLLLLLLWAKNKEVWKSSPTWDNPKGSKQDFKSNFDKAKPKMDYKDLCNKAKLETPSKIKYFKCQGYGHKANECPNRITIIALNDGGYQTENKSKDDHREDDSSYEIMEEGD
ncbi:hypothetical protein R3W88_001411 [Solanum pinnatisectum]|uniref:CCHC-type domain-containing protein n=1 Tax=Solanum pinnatisectum TaxID=50273 RepID=A0AAV9MKV7_9SOLN|nr:hypothetical protein R3W88_001411 [Solanum pinnatisectum]